MMGTKWREGYAAAKPSPTGGMTKEVPSLSPALSHAGERVLSCESVHFGSLINRNNLCKYKFANLP